MHPQIEFSVNDGSTESIDSPIRRAYERLVRKVLELPHRPAVVMLQTFSGFREGSLCVTVPQRPKACRRDAAVYTVP